MSGKSQNELSFYAFDERGNVTVPRIAPESASGRPANRFLYWRPRNRPLDRTTHMKYGANV